MTALQTMGAAMRQNRKSRPTMRHFERSLGIILLVLGLTSPLSAQTLSTALGDGGGSGNNWTTAGNWSGGIPVDNGPWWAI